MTTLVTKEPTRIDNTSSRKRSKKDPNSNDDDDDSSSHWDDGSPLVERVGPDIFDNHDNKEEQGPSNGGISIGPDTNLRYAADTYVEAGIAAMEPSDREKVYFDVHGMSASAFETPDLIQSSLEKFQSAVDRLLLASNTSNVHRTIQDESGYGLRGIFSTKAYELALSLDKQYVEDRELWLAFLRTEKFTDCTAAVERFFRWFQVKLDLFGVDLLTKNITQDDLASLEEENKDGDLTIIDSLTDGFKQILPLRDHAGRLVFCDFVANSCFDATKSAITKLRRKFYMSMVAAEDPETQSKGAIMVWYAVGATDQAPLDDWNYIRGIFAVLNCLPLRIEAVHSCHDNHWKYAVKVALFRLTCGIFLSARTRVHVGHHSKCLFVLQTYGIPVSVMPLSADGSFQVTNHQNALLWTQRRDYERNNLAKNKRESSREEEPPENMLFSQVPETFPELGISDEDIESLLNKDRIGNAIESAPFCSDDDEKPTGNRKTATQESQKEVIAGSAAYKSRPLTILVPGQFDVLLGRGAGYHCHAGNVRLRGMIEDKLEAHKSCQTSEEKVAITLEIVKQIQTGNGRFLKQERSSGWTKVSDHEARLKVGHTFRNMRAAARKDNKKT